LKNEQKIAKNLEKLAEKIRLNFSAKDAAREKALHISREVIRYCANSIRATHRHEPDNANQLLASAQNLLKELSHNVLHQNSELAYVGFVHDAQKEFAEASCTIAIVSGKPLAQPEALGVSYAAYLNGLGEAVGELRRYILDSLRRNDLSRCEELLAIMNDIYATLMTMDYPDGITYGLRRTGDSVRGILERTRGDLTLALRQQALEEKLDRTTRIKK